MINEILLISRIGQDIVLFLEENKQKKMLEFISMSFVKNDLDYRYKTKNEIRLAKLANRIDSNDLISFGKNWDQAFLFRKKESSSRKKIINLPQCRCYSIFLDGQITCFFFLFYHRTTGWYILMTIHGTSLVCCMLYLHLLRHVWSIMRCSETER